MFSSVDEYQCLGHNNSHPAIKKKQGISTFAKVLIGAGGLLLVGAAAVATVAIMNHIEKKKFEPCDKCKRILDTKLEDIFSKEDRKTTPALETAKAALIT
jgi:hypothetical protein